MKKKHPLVEIWAAIPSWYGERKVDIWLTVLGLVIALWAAGYSHFLAPASREGHLKVVYIQEGTGFLEVSRLLEEEGVVRDRRSFYLLARLRGLIPRIKAGEYEFHTRLTPGEVLRKMVQGDVLRYPVTIPEGLNLFEIGEVLERAQVCNLEIFLAKAKDFSFIRSLGLDLESLEGFLFPDTYNFPRGFGEENAIRQMIQRFKSVYVTFAKRAEELGLTRYQVVTLASMIEKEASDDQERSLISAVFHNRLQRGMALQSDPTAIYGMSKSRRERITRQDLLRKTPYNTYLVNGLPKGPIANPGFKSLQAALYPAEVSYLFFVSKNDGTHHFSRTLGEHQRAVSRFQKNASRADNRKPLPEKDPSSREAYLDSEDV